MAGFSEFHLKCVYFMSALDVFSIGMSIPLLSPYLKSIGASHFVIGLSTSLYGAAQLISSPLVGSWSDRHGRVPVLSLSLGMCSLGYLIQGQLSSAQLILLIRIFLGCFKHTQSLCKSIIGDEVPPYEQANAYGKLAAISGIGFIVGPVVGGHIADSHQGYSYVTMMIFICYLINIGIAQYLPTSHHQRTSRAVYQGLQSELNVVLSHLKEINWSKHSKILFLKFLHVFTLSFYFSNFSLVLQEKYGMTTKAVGYLISFQSIVGSSTGFLSGQIQHLYEWRYPPQRAAATQVVHCFIAVALGLIGFNYADNTISLLLWMVPIASGSALLRTLLTELLVQKSAPQERGSLLGASQSFGSFSRLCTPLIAGIVSDSFGIATVPILSQIVATVGAISGHFLLKAEYIQHYIR